MFRAAEFVIVLKIDFRASSTEFETGKKTFPLHIKNNSLFLEVFACFAVKNKNKTKLFCRFHALFSNKEFGFLLGYSNKSQFQI